MGNSKSKKREDDTEITQQEKLYDEKSNISAEFRGKVYNVICDKNESLSSIFEKIGLISFVIFIPPQYFAKKGY